LLDPHHVPHPRAGGESGERRDQFVHPAYQKPELLATAPNQLWSWDITKLMGPVKGTYFYLYVILDVFSRYVVGWMVAPRESAELAKKFIEETIGKHQVPAGQLHIHADRGKVMTSKPVAFLMADLGVTKTHSRPYVSDDNPYSESQFRTLKYRPEFPDRFGCIQDSRAFCQQFFQCYNEPHRHSGIGLLTPAMVHFGDAQTVLARRQAVLHAAYEAHPDRFVRQPPKPLPLPSEVWINKSVPSGQKTPEGSQ
jgi:putative transposase